MSRIIAVEGPMRGKIFNLGQVNILGRSFDADIHIDDLTVSRHHARIQGGPQGFTIEDMGSGNGTFLNERLVEGVTALQVGDRVRISGNVFQFMADEVTSPTGVPDSLEPSRSLVELSPRKDETVVEKLDVKATLMDRAPVSTDAADPALVRKAHARLQTVLAVSNAVQSQLDMDDLLDQILEELFSVFPQADRGFVMLQDDETDGDLVAKAARQRGKKAPDAITVSRHVIDEVVGQRVALLTADAMGDDRFGGAESIMNFQIRSMMCAPLIANEDFLGVIHVDTLRQDRPFNMDDLDLLTAVANQTAFAVANARLHARLMTQQRMERDLTLARQVQESFMPDAPPEMPGVELAATYRAAYDVGGDFYDMIRLDEHRLGIGLGDVAGKGVPAALLMARMSSDMRQNATPDCSPASVLTAMNAHLAASGQEGAFVTALFLILDTRTRMLTISNAGQCYPVLRRANGEVREIDVGGGFPLGTLEDMEYEEGSFQLEPGDILILLSDGITEAMDAGRIPYGDVRLEQGVGRPATTAQKVMDNVIADVAAHVKNTPPSDDITIVCFRVE